VPGREVLVAEVTLFPLDAEVRHLVTLASKAAGELLPAVRAEVRGETDVAVAPVRVGPGKRFA
jgi:hypothetical protein